MNIEIVGTITAVQPLSITQMDSRTPGVPMMPFVVGGEIVQQIYIPSTSLRGMLRTAAVKNVIDAISDGPKLPFDRNTYYWNRIGGVKGTDKDLRGTDVLIAGEMMKKNPVIALFGAGEVFVRGKVAVGEARQSSDLRARDLNFTRVGQRRDDLMSDPELFARISDQDASDHEAYTTTKKDVSANKRQLAEMQMKIKALKKREASLTTEERADLADLEEKKTGIDAQIRESQAGGIYKNAINMPHSNQVIAAGTVFDHWIRATSVDQLQLGCLLDALRRFSIDCRVGGLENRGCGEILADYAVRMHDGKTFDENDNPAYVDVGRLTLARGAFAIEPVGDVLTSARKVWKDAKANKLAGFDFAAPKRAA
ncbi:RAMP superfamily CRISPR-associated protein [Bosea sp. RAC05]|uniref:RAMP superfamily CRISPR-associated protein n=1 Tax=Bosea sp. RAC05 TaxID=1842539 RepID=UPI000856EFCA|nr:RAMP superfamily CRISPR-associated protein [Bosea sp. RAC05]AOG03002.1 RAMP superfamily protein [Bosea sp. RAC05]